jgi:hypothetical protein
VGSATCLVFECPTIKEIDGAPQAKVENDIMGVLYWGEFILLLTANRIVETL